ncbi:multiple epidermal growth factor-like domains protein 10 [Mya arenaria]|uniref:multiple epidermal growth factor-like domains protein 10 n=1 Tax=Mya arenaria TaxID=6604 RepID=UPI0022DF4B0F|nr:multiple epidermal growth factor-like domains protein 10 [Mya arenaria]
MMFWIFCLLCFARSCIGVFIDGVDCSLNCVCCKGGVDECGFKSGLGINICLNGCVDGLYGYKCNNPCPGNCSSCEPSDGRPCYSCKATFYDRNSECSKSCSVGCDGGVCNNDGACSPCRDNFEGTKCETCIQGKFGSSCSQYCIYQNCRCSTGTDCTSCKMGFYDRNTFCQTACSPGCQNAVCNDNGSCNCRAEFMGNKCSECQSGYYGAYCNVSCSTGCVNGLCLKDGTCLCHPNFVTEKCDTCADGRYGVNCDEICSVGCTKRSCDRSNGFCECRPNFSGDKCDQCISGFYEQLCNLPCSDNCNERTCSRYQGNCTHGCVDGYSGQHCTTPCNKTCVTCLQHDNSHCVSCYNGFSGSTCRCPSNCNCDSASDVCTTSADGYANPKKQCKCQTQYCTETVCDKCINQTFYVDNNACCECPKNCKDVTCIDGPECISGCIDGFTVWIVLNDVCH